MGIKNLKENIQKRGLKDILDKDVRKSFSEYKDIEKHGLFLEASDIISYTEQLQYRLSKCSRCLSAGKCIGYDTEGCSCPTPDKMVPPSAKCPEGRWKKMMEAAEWTEYKKENNIEILVVEP